MLFMGKSTRNGNVQLVQQRSTKTSSLRGFLHQVTLTPSALTAAQFWARFDEEAKKWKKDQRRGPPYVRHRHETKIFLLPILCDTICQNEPFGLSTSC